jgi:hypothetical protein
LGSEKNRYIFQDSIRAGKKLQITELTRNRKYHKMISISKASKGTQTFGWKSESLFIICYCFLIFPVQTINIT